MRRVPSLPRTRHSRSRLTVSNAFVTSMKAMKRPRYRFLHFSWRSLQTKITSAMLRTRRKPHWDSGTTVSTTYCMPEDGPTSHVKVFLYGREKGNATAIAVDTGWPKKMHIKHIFYFKSVHQLSALRIDRCTRPSFQFQKGWWLE